MLNLEKYYKMIWKKKLMYGHAKRVEKQNPQKMALKKSEWEKTKI